MWLLALLFIAGRPFQLPERATDLHNRCFIVRSLYDYVKKYILVTGTTIFYCLYYVFIAIVGVFMFLGYLLLLYTIIA